MRYWRAISRACFRSSGVKSMRSFSVTPWSSKGAGLVGNGWVGQVFSSGVSDCGTARSSIGHTGSPGLAVEDVGEALLGDRGHGGDLAPADRDVDEVRRVGVVVVPDVVVDHLEVPDALARLHVERDEARPVEVRPVAVAAVVVVGRRVGGDEDEAALRVGGERRPGRDVPRVRPGVALPGVVAELARLGQDVEAPEHASRLGVVAADVPGDVLLALRVVPAVVRVADHDHAVHDDRGRGGGDVARGERSRGPRPPGSSPGRGGGPRCR